MMRLLFILLPALLLTASIGACGGSDDDGRLRVVATTTQIGALAREVGGDRIQLAVLLQAGADAHDFEPSARDAVTLNQAGLVLMNGIGLDEWVERVIEGAGAAERIVVVTGGITLYESPRHDDDRASGDDHSHDDADPHVWHDPANVKVMVSNIVAALGTADPANASLYEANGAAYQQKLDEVDAEIRSLFAEIPEENRKLVTNHDAFGYFLRAYGLEFVGAVIPGAGSGAQPSAQQLAALTDLIRSEGVKAIFAEAEVDPRVAQQLANDTGVRIVDGLYADSLGAPGSGAETVDGMLLFNARKIAEALK
ncbi:MAG TPA: metal ABC transporter substrate-binding protein [Tepidiformaceae bacterium]|nr:metal ABC transporter substrate-binding protein [Tepidiformaceae bacterium]